jgi:hypothetical protein
VAAGSAPVPNTTFSDALFILQKAAVSDRNMIRFALVRPARHQLELLSSLHDAVKMRHSERTAAR